ncbi:aldose 1-epimerase [Azoarcus sp. L1K30]|uniref:aldose 1-epimerase n=1 Tax=Azoarcus sp. L1K30 TaxID=2820277 RepID=UPI001B8315B1|nr:aldose 1-epimerase [Azoarcus sp. L1K30]MBR0568729.1 aldose 1-epimerase [Azoarcus sp. L1K30]
MMHAPVSAPAVTGFRVRRESFRGIDALRFSNDAMQAVFALRGATLLDWRVRTDDGELGLTDGYRSAAELDAQNGVRNGILAPFQNRIAHARYCFDGVMHDLLPACGVGAREIYHGFARMLDFEPLLMTDGRDGAAAVLACEGIRPGVFPGYPFAISLRIRLALSAAGIALHISATNVGERDAPVTLGWHPYFRLGEGGIDALELKLPATERILTDARLIPLPGDAARASLGTRPEADFRAFRVLGGTVLDCCHGGNVAGADGLIRSVLRDPRSGHRLSVWQESGLVHVFTGDTLARDARRAIAIEPVDAPTDAFNREACAADIRLPPMASRTFSCGVDFLASSHRTQNAGTCS